VTGLPDNRLQASPGAWLEGLPTGWQPLVEAWRASEAGRRTLAHLADRLAAGATVYPADPLRALRLLAPEKVRVLILGQDPYHGVGQAQGLAFGVAPGLKLPPSLRNILQEVCRDVGVVSARAATGDLTGWAEQGVLLLNTTLTVEDAQPASHSRLGWADLVDVLLRGAALARAEMGLPLVALLWGGHAQARASVLEGLPPGDRRPLPAAATSVGPLASCRSGSPAPVSWRGDGSWPKNAAIVTGSLRRGARVAKGGRL
jgi:uracil-DNA glycosylase